MKFKTTAWLFSAMMTFSFQAQAEDLAVPPKRDEAIKTEAPEEIIVSEKLGAGAVITLQKAIRKAVDNSPRLKAAVSAKAASAGEREQAGVLPNPQLSFDVENFAGGGDFKGLDSAEMTYGVSQLIEIGGKRGARIGIADKGMNLAELDLENERLNLIRDVTAAYSQAVTAQEQVKLANDQKKLATEVLETVTRRVDAAADPLYQKSKAKVANSTSIIALDKAERNAVLAKQKLTVLWGENKSDFSLDAREFFDITAPLELDDLNDEIKNNPDYLRWDIELERKNAAVELEKANAIPDPSVSFGVRDLRESGNQAFVAGVSLPIPVFNSNSGNISRALAESSKTEMDRLEARNQIAAELNRNWHEMQNSYKQAESLKGEIIPSAEESFKLARHGYEIGKFPYLEVLDAQRTLFESREQYHSSLKQYHISRAEVERLTAKNKFEEASNEE